MNLQVSDPHPGRCRNHRTRLDRGYYRTVRCLDYEDTPHVCSFEPVIVGPPVNPSHNSSSRVDPKPWVKP